MVHVPINRLELFGSGMKDTAGRSNIAMADTRIKGTNTAYDAMRNSFLSVTTLREKESSDRKRV